MEREEKCAGRKGRVAYSREPGGEESDDIQIVSRSRCPDPDQDQQAALLPAHSGQVMAVGKSPGRTECVGIHCSVLNLPISPPPNGLMKWIKALGITG